MLCCSQLLQIQKIGFLQEDDSFSQKEADVFSFSIASSGSGHLPPIPSVVTKDAERKHKMRKPNKISEPNKVMISKKQRLRFSPTISTIIGTGLSREDYTAQEKKNCWLAPEEIFKSRAHVKRVMTLIRYSGQHFVAMIDDSFRVAQQLSTSLREKERDALMRDPNNFHSEIDASEFNGQGRRGLERQMSVFQKMTGRGIREKVLRNQARMDVSGEEVAENMQRNALRVASMRYGWAVSTIYWPTCCRSGTLLCSQ